MPILTLIELKSIKRGAHKARTIVAKFSGDEITVRISMPEKGDGFRARRRIPPRPCRGPGHGASRAEMNPPARRRSDVWSLPSVGNGAMAGAAERREHYGHHHDTAERRDAGAGTDKGGQLARIGARQNEGRNPRTLCG